MITSTPSKLAHYRQRGFSLTELMVASTIGLFIMIALIALFINISRTNVEMAKMNAQIENGRYAIQILQHDIAHAGFWGNYLPKPAAAIPDTCVPFELWTDEHKTDLLGIPLQIYGDTAPTGAGCAPNIFDARMPNTDALLLRHAETCLPGEENCEALVSNALYFQSSLSYGGICPQGSNRTPDTIPFILDTTDFDTLTKNDCLTPVTEKRKFISNLYYVRNYARNPGDKIPTLMLSRFDTVTGTLAQQPAIALIEGIEGFVVEVGAEAPEGEIDGAPEGEFFSCSEENACDVETLANVLMVRIHLLARADSPSPGYSDNKQYVLGPELFGPFEDGYKRHVFSTTIRLNNISSRREDL
jgi:type IV pilus assembly protein PilW